VNDPTGIPAPDPRLLIDYVDGELSPEEARRVERLIESSGAWRAELELARSFAQTPAKDAPEEVRARAWAAVDPGVVPLVRSRRSWLPPLLAAASLAVLVLAGRTWWESRPIGDEATVRSVAGEVEIPLAAVRAEGGWRLQWDPPDGIAAARLVVTDVRGRVVHEEETPSPRTPFLDGARLPESAGPLLVRIVAVGKEGGELRSGLAELAD